MVDFDTFIPVRPPTTRSTTKITPRVRRVDYGDGYSDVRPDGLNTMLEVVTAVWVQPTTDAVDAMEAFFRAKMGAVPFWYKMPWNDTAKLWRAKEWGRGFDEDPHETYTVTFEEVAVP